MLNLIEVSWTILRAGEPVLSCCYWLSLFTFLVPCPLKLGLGGLVRNVSSEVSTGSAVRHCLRSCLAAGKEGCCPMGGIIMVSEFEPLAWPHCTQIHIWFRKSIFVCPHQRFPCSLYQRETALRTGEEILNQTSCLAELQGLEEGLSHGRSHCHQNIHTWPPTSFLTHLLKAWLPWRGQVVSRHWGGRGLSPFFPSSGGTIGCTFSREPRSLGIPRYALTVWSLFWAWDTLVA